MGPFAPPRETIRSKFAPDSLLEGEGFEPPVPRRDKHFRDRPGTRLRQAGPVGRTDFDDRQGQVYRAPSQAGPGNDINAGSLGFQKAPMRGPASLVAIRL